MDEQRQEASPDPRGEHARGRSVTGQIFPRSTGQILDAFDHYEGD